DEFGGAEKLKGGGELQKAHHHFDGVEPGPALGEFAQQRGKQRQKKEWRCKRYGECQSAKQVVPERSRCGSRPAETTQKGGDAGKADDRERQGHEDGANQASLSFPRRRELGQAAR